MNIAVNIGVIARAIAILAWCAAVAHAQPAATSEVLRDANSSALAGDWTRVASLVDPLLRQQLPPADLLGVPASARRADRDRRRTAA